MEKIVLDEMLNLIGFPDGDAIFCPGDVHMGTETREQTRPANTQAHARTHIHAYIHAHLIYKNNNKGRKSCLMIKICF